MQSNKRCNCSNTVKYSSIIFYYIGFYTPYNGKKVNDVNARKYAYIQYKRSLGFDFFPYSLSPFFTKHEKSMCIGKKNRFRHGKNRCSDHERTND